MNADVYEVCVRLAHGYLETRKLDKGLGHFFTGIDLKAGRYDRIGWYGAIDVTLISLLRRACGLVPAPYPFTPRQMLRPHTGFKRSLQIVPASVRHLREWTDWNRPTTWPLAAAVFRGEIVDLYGSHIEVLPARQPLDLNRINQLTSCGTWQAWCEAADDIGFFGSPCNDGGAPYILLLGNDTTRSLQSSMIASPFGEPPESLLKFRFSDWRTKNLPRK